MYICMKVDVQNYKISQSQSNWMWKLALKIKTIWSHDTGDYWIIQQYNKMHEKSNHIDHIGIPHLSPTLTPFPVSSLW